MIQASGLVKTFGDIRAVDGIGFGIARGESFGLLGPNGAGKTTTISMLVGVMTPDAGQVTIGGESDPTQPEVRRKIGSAPQALSLYEELTGDENLRFFGRIHGLARADVSKRVDWALDFAGLTDRRGDRVKTYSGGMKRRLNLACAMVHDPPALFLDEPTVGVDPQSRNQIFCCIEALKAEGRTVLYTTHYMEEAQRLCDRVAIIDAGKILALDGVDALIAAHGGQSVVEIELHAPPADPTALPGALDGTSLRIETDEPLDVVGQLASDMSFKSLKVEQADLGTVFLNLTGRRLRD